MSERDKPAAPSASVPPTSVPPASIPPGKAAALRLERVTKRFAGNVQAVRELDLAIRPGEFIVLVGPSGCGKSTVLRMIAGLEEVSSGRIHLGDRDVTNALAQQRDVAMVFQSYALYPRMTVRENIAFGLRMRGVDKAERERRVTRVAGSLGLTPLLERRPSALSGGQRQRVAMGRAIVREPQAFLMDEPLSNLDAKLRVSMRAQLSLLHRRLGVTTVYVTHDQTEAMTLGHRVAVLRDGILQQFDTPQALFRDPVNLFVASFIGSPSMNFVAARVSGGQAQFAGLALPLPPGSSLAGGDRQVILGIRPTAFAPKGDSSGPKLQGVAAFVEELGDERFVMLDIDAPPPDTTATRAAQIAMSVEDTLLVQGPKRARWMVRLPTDAPIALGEPLTVSVDARRLHFFDPESGAALR